MFRHFEAFVVAGDCCMDLFVAALLFRIAGPDVLSLKGLT